MSNYLPELFCSPLTSVPPTTLTNVHSTVTPCNLWISDRREFLVSKSVDRLLVLAQIQLGADKNDRRRRTVMAHLRKPLLTTHTQHSHYSSVSLAKHVDCTQSRMGHRRSGNVHLADQGNMVVDGRIRPPACSEYWSVHWLPASSTLLDVGEFVKTATLLSRGCTWRWWWFTLWSPYNHSL